MSRPVIVCADSDPDARTDEELTKRYAADYELCFASDGREAMAAVEGLAAEQRELALVIADESLGEPSGIDVLAHVRIVSPHTQRALLIRAGERAVQGSALRAAALGLIHSWLVKPTAGGLLEEFHHGVSGALYSWSQVNRPFEWVQMIGADWSARTHQIRDLLVRNRIPFGYSDAASGRGQGLLGEVGKAADRLPVLVIGEREVLVQPSLTALATSLGAQTHPHSPRYDVVVIGAGPAGLAAAVSAASEGLTTLVVEREAIGGQAGTSSLIRNYLGFPLGISGSELALRAFHQALLFGAEFVFANCVAGLTGSGRDHVLTLLDGREVRSRSVVIASGVNYRRLSVPALEHRVGAGVYYGAAATEADAMSGLDVGVVGGGNSAGQAALKLANHARHVTVLVRGPALADTMSAYLVSELDRTPHIDVLVNVEVVAGDGEPLLRTLTLRDLVSGHEKVVAANALFVLIGADPTTNWLPATIQRDRRGYLLTGDDAESPAPSRPPMGYETTLPGVFAVGDVRHGSTKRVASAVGEGSACVRSVFARLATMARSTGR